MGHVASLSVQCFVAGAAAGEIILGHGSPLVWFLLAWCIVIALFEYGLIRAALGKVD